MKLTTLRRPISRLGRRNPNSGRAERERAPKFGRSGSGVRGERAGKWNEEGTLRLLARKRNEGTSNPRVATKFEEERNPNPSLRERRRRAVPGRWRSRVASEKRRTERGERGVGWWESYFTILALFRSVNYKSVATPWALINHSTRPGYDVQALLGPIL